MTAGRRFPLLVRLFVDRFFENDTVAPGGGFQTNIWQVLGFLVAAGWFISYFLMPPFLRVSMVPGGEQTAWAVRTLRLFFTASSFAVVGFTAVFEADTLFPDRRDFLILGSFPLRPVELLAAKFAALGLFLLLFIAALNAFPVLMMIALSILVPGLRGSGVRLVASHLAATGGASLFAFSLVAAFQGVLMMLSTPRFFQRILPSIQMVGMSAMILSLLMYPIYSILLRPASQTHRLWPWLFPPVWFAGVYELILPPRGEFVSFGLYGLKLLAGVIAVFTLTWIFGFRRHYTRTLESDVIPPKSASRRWPALLMRLPEERAIGDFTARTLARSRKHQLFLATWISVGLSIALLFAVAVRDGQLVLSYDGARAFPFFLIFFVISGIRAAFQFPADLAANWIFRITESRWSQIARQATRKRVLAGTLVPALLLLMLPQLAVWTWKSVLFQAAFQFVAGALLIEAMFWTFQKVPFTCSYFPGNTNLSLLAGLYLYGFTMYSFQMADLGKRIEGDWPQAGLVFATGAALLAISWARRPKPSTVRFDAEEPAITTLDLT